jgi:tungstate transport system ATP-binding protein
LRLSDRIAVMNQGRILQVGPPAEVMNHPLDEFVASFMGVDTILTGRVIKKDGGSFVASIMGQEVVAVGEIELGESVVFCIRPENVTLAIDPFHESSSARNLFSGRIVKVTHLGLYHKVQLHCGFPLVAYVTTQSLENLSLTEGKEVFASFKATSIHVLRKKGERL